jgi:hypothetical protein
MAENRAANERCRRPNPPKSVLVMNSEIDKRGQNAFEPEFVDAWREPHGNIMPKFSKSAPPPEFYYSGLILRCELLPIDFRQARDWGQTIARLSFSAAQRIYSSSAVMRMLSILTRALSSSCVPASRAIVPWVRRGSLTLATKTSLTLYVSSGPFAVISK